MSASRIKLGAILVGWVMSLFTLVVVVAASVLLALYLKVDIASPLESGQLNSFYINFTIFVGVFLAFFTGGYVAGRMAALAGVVNGALVVATNILATFFAGTFSVIVGNSLEIDITGSITETIGGLTSLLILVGLFSIAGGMLGGRLGEGYFTRLEIALARKEQRAQQLMREEQAAKGQKATPKATTVHAAEEKQAAKQRDLEEAKQAS